MKKQIIRFATLLFVITASLSLSAFAADAITVNNAATLIPQNGASLSFASSDAYEEKILVTYTNPDVIPANSYYSVMVIDAATGGSNYIPNKDSILYFNQTTSTADGSLSFYVYPMRLADSAIIICGEGVQSLIVGIIDVVNTVPMFRMYDPNGGEHFYTGSEEERDILVDVGWNYEGVAFNFPAVGAPVHRLYDPVSGDHLYTMEEDEKASLLAEGWNYEGVAFNSAADTEVAQYRLYNPNAHPNGTRGAWHFTGSEEERDWLIGLGWQYQGIGWYSTLT